jgi:phospholipid/cholesterol/gamma-HCH transport system substrate-binding protein
MNATSKVSTDAKVGIFILTAIAAIIALSFAVTDVGMLFGDSYELYLKMKRAEGISYKTPVQVAGIRVGYVDEIKLLPSGQAQIRLKIDEEVQLRGKVSAQILTRGVLGDTYIELFTDGFDTEKIQGGAVIENVREPEDFNSIAQSFGEIAKDIKEITTAIKSYTVKEQAIVPKILKNIESLTKTLDQLSQNNAANISALVNNMKLLSADLRLLVKNNESEVDQSLRRIASITEKIDRGQGTIGSLINDKSTIEKYNKVADNLNKTLGSLSSMKTRVGWHVEYLTNSSDFKNYFSLELAPKPDKYFLLEVIADADPSPETVDRTTNITVGGNTTTVQTETNTIDRDRLLFSAQVAKRYKDITLRGGIIESRGGVGIDYTKGPFEVKFSAFDLRNDSGRRPHLKTWVNFQITDTIYLLGGVDDFLSKQHGADWFLGAGIKFDDEDVKSLLGLIGTAAGR